MSDREDPLPWFHSITVRECHRTETDGFDLQNCEVASLIGIYKAHIIECVARIEVHPHGFRVCDDVIVRGYYTVCVNNEPRPHHVTIPTAESLDLDDGRAQPLKDFGRTNLLGSN